MKKYAVIILLTVALAVSGILIWAAVVFNNTRFFTLASGEGEFVRRGQVLVNETNKTSLYYCANGQSESSKINSVSFENNTFCLAVFDSKSFDYTSDPDALLYGAGTAASAAVKTDGKLYRISKSGAEPVFAGSAIWDEYGDGIEAFSTDGTFCAGITNGSINVVKLNALTPESSYAEKLGLTNPRIIRFLNGVHLWIEADEGLFVWDCEKKTSAKCPDCPFEGEVYSSVWRFSGFDENKTASLFNLVTGVRKNITLPENEKDARLIEVSPSAKRLLFENGGRYFVMNTEDGKPDYFDESALSVYLASDSLAAVNTENGYELVRIVH